MSRTSVPGLTFMLVLSLASPGAAQERPRVIVSTDIGGSDPDDFQSMVHFLLYADRFDIEGVISSPWGAGRTSDIFTVIDKYALDYPNLVTHSRRYPSPDALRAVTREGALDPSWSDGFGKATAGSDWIVRCAKRNDPRPLWVLVWGTIDDVAQALHDDPSIAPKLRVYYISGPNKKWGVAAYDYIETHHPDVWIIENNSTYRGWFNGGPQDGDLGNRSFVSAHVKGHGALGEYFSTMLGGEIKMGDTPSVAYLLDSAAPEDPTRDSWGGRFVRAWVRPKATFTRLTTAADRIEQFGIVEITLPLGSGEDARGVTAKLVIDGQDFPGFASSKASKGSSGGGQDQGGGGAGAGAGGAFTFRFMPKDVKTWGYAIVSSSKSLDGKRGAFTSFAPPADSASHPDPRHPHWWTDDPDPREAEGPHQGARTVSRWREAFLRDFADRMERAAAPAHKPR